MLAALKITGPGWTLQMHQCRSYDMQWVDESPSEQICPLPRQFRLDLVLYMERLCAEM